MPKENGHLCTAEGLCALVCFPLARDSRRKASLAVCHVGVSEIGEAVAEGQADSESLLLG